MHLQIEGAKFPIAQMGPDYLRLWESASHPPCEASIHVFVEEEEEMWTVSLPHGLIAGEKKVRMVLKSEQVADLKSR